MKATHHTRLDIGEKNYLVGHTSKYNTWLINTLKDKDKVSSVFVD